MAKRLNFRALDITTLVMGFMLRRKTLSLWGERYHGHCLTLETVWNNRADAEEVRSRIADRDHWTVVTEAEAASLDARYVLRQGPGCYWSVQYATYAEAESHRDRLPNARTYRVYRQSDADHLDRGRELFVLRRISRYDGDRYWRDAQGCVRRWRDVDQAREYQERLIDPERWEALSEAQAEERDRHPHLGSSVESLFDELGELGQIQERARNNTMVAVSQRMPAPRTTMRYATLQRFGGRRACVGDDVLLCTEAGVVHPARVQGIAEDDVPILGRMVVVGEALVMTTYLAGTQLLRGEHFEDVRCEADLNKLRPGCWCWMIPVL